MMGFDHTHDFEQPLTYIYSELLPQTCKFTLVDNSHAHLPSKNRVAFGDGETGYDAACGGLMD
jgi:hypothetical protein